MTKILAVWNGSKSGDLRNNTRNYLPFAVFPISHSRALPSHWGPLARMGMRACARAWAVARSGGAPSGRGSIAGRIGQAFRAGSILLSVFQLSFDAPERFQRGFQALHDLPRHYLGW